MADDVLGNIVSDKQDVKNQLGSIPVITPVIRRFSSPLKIKHKYNLVRTRDINASFIIGHPTQAKRDFTLLDESYGQYVTQLAVPYNNIYTEYFSIDTLINSTISTGTLDTGVETYTTGIGEILQSEIIHKTGELVSTVTFTDVPVISLGNTTFKLDTGKLDTDPLSNQGEGVFKISNDNGTTWFPITTFGTTTVFTNPSSDGVIYNFTAVSEYIWNSGDLTININGTN